MPGPERDTPARRRSADLPAEASRADWFGALREVLAELQLSEPGNVYLQSGRSSGAARWQETRRCIADAVHRDGHFLDLGCANGLLLESLIGWCGERGITLRRHGIDLLAPLIALARERHPGHPSLGYEIVGSSGAPGVSLAWLDPPA